MKFSTSQLIVIAAVLLSALIGANHFAPGAYAQVANYVGILFGIFFLNRHDDPPPPNTGAGPNLRVLAGGAAILALAVAGGAVGCVGSGLGAVDSVNDPSVDEALSKCRGDARAAYQTANVKGPDGSAIGPGMKPDEAYQIYVDCTKDAGLR